MAATAPIRIRFRIFLTALLVAVALLLGVGVSGFWQLIAQSPIALLQGAEQPSAVASVFVPRQSPIVLTLLTRPDRLLSLRQILTSPQQRRQAEAEAERLKRSLAVSTGLDYENDIQPWLGDEVTAAIVDLDLDRIPENGQQMGYLIVAAVRPGQSARPFLQLFWQRQALQGRPPVFAKLNGVQLIYSDVEQPGSAIATAAVGQQFVLFANNPQILRRSLSSAQSLPLSLADTPTQRQSLLQLSPNRIGLAQVRLKELLSLLGQDSLPSKETLPPDEPPVLNLGFSLTRLGLLADWILQPGRAQLPELPALREPVQALRYLPPDTAIAVGSRNLPPVLDSLNGLGIVPKLGSRLIAMGQQSMTELESGPDSARWSWITGEYALGLLPGERQPDWILIAEQTADSEAAIADLDRQALTQGYSVSTVALDQAGRSTARATAWTRLQTDRQNNQLDTEVLGLHARVGDYEIFATSLAALEQALTAPQASLLDSSAFLQATAALETPNNGYLYLNWPQLEPIATPLLPSLSLAKVVAQPLFEHLDGIALSRYSGGADQQQGGLFIRLVETVTERG
ncbi:DUF3352 domain-containing protein [Romeria aff. gracilis LEGE 07310]|uniref:DUF3352 domain-containing protein n=1 Tax=Vasconcelosia minhoensis LEGE 07310 TaxID=915328 RepID=A0A8J7A9A0_9CYAN|nr:DUF3352 domain-containing protein [Romeria gracilis]MBE9079607.1 DUF3352 domain-containing protein [Romeria aff. gracilis LEGE 07310]